MSGDNFVDLRISHVGISGGEDSVWPSFTDVMTVIVMIFLMVLLAFLIRNTQLVDELKVTIDDNAELVDELKITISEKEQAAKAALLNASENTTLQEQLARVRERVLSLQSTLENVSGERETLAQKLESREKAVADLEIEIALLSKLRDELTSANSGLLKDIEVSAQSLAAVETDLEGVKNTLNEKIALLLAEKADLVVAKEKETTALSESEQEKAELSKKLISLTEQLRLVRKNIEAQSSENTELNQQLEDKNVLMLGLQTSKAELEKKVAEMAADLEKLTALYSTRGDEVTALQVELENRGKRFKSLQDELDALDEKYRKLIRPARNAAGKHVVRVEHTRTDGKLVYLLTEPGGEQKALTEKALHARLAALAKEHKAKLYTKIIIPKESGLSHDQAWQFTQNILSKYDYYAQDFATP